MSDGGEAVRRLFDTAFDRAQAMDDDEVVVSLRLLIADERFASLLRVILDFRTHVLDSARQNEVVSQHGLLAERLGAANAAMDIMELIKVRAAAKVEEEE